MMHILANGHFATGVGKRGVALISAIESRSYNNVQVATRIEQVKDTEYETTFRILFRATTMEGCWSNRKGRIFGAVHVGINRYGDVLPGSWSGDTESWIVAESYDKQSCVPKVNGVFLLAGRQAAIAVLNVLADRALHNFITQTEEKLLTRLPYEPTADEIKAAAEWSYAVAENFSLIPEPENYAVCETANERVIGGHKCIVHNAEELATGQKFLVVNNADERFVGFCARM